MISVLIAGCKKDEDDPDPTPQPENPKTYTGTTEQDLPATFGTAEIEGILHLSSYSIDLVYHDTVHGSTHQATLSQSSSSGIVLFSGDSFLYNGTDLTLSGSLENGDEYLKGEYTWEYDGTNTYSGSFNTVKQ